MAFAKTYFFAKAASRKAKEIEVMILKFSGLRMNFLGVPMHGKCPNGIEMSFGMSQWHRSHRSSRRSELVGCSKTFQNYSHCFAPLRMGPR